MALQNYLHDRMGEMPVTGAALGEYIEDLVVELLEEPTIRQEIWADAQFALSEGCSIADVHVVIDSLIKSFRDPQD
jgi:hypothetical protein